MFSLIRKILQCDLFVLPQIWTSIYAINNIYQTAILVSPFLVIPSFLNSFSILFSTCHLAVLRLSVPCVSTCSTHLLSDWVSYDQYYPLFFLPPLIFFKSLFYHNITNTILQQHNWTCLLYTSGQGCVNYTCKFYV